MISPGLHRMRTLLRHLGNPEGCLNALHVAGTNGKGSVCTYLESALKAAGHSTAKYTSPHLIHPNDSISLNGNSMNALEYRLRFEELEQKFGQRAGASLGATPFEIGTALALVKMAEFDAEYSIVETGMGGLLDATNVLPAQAVKCVAITKIAVDHEAFLGNTEESVAKHKAGILKSRVPCVVDGSNSVDVLKVVESEALRVGSPLVLAGTGAGAGFIEQNKSVAREVLKLVGVYNQLCENGIDAAVWPGRMQFLNKSTLVDGCHNISGATELANVVDQQRAGKKVRWVMAFSKPCGAIIKQLVKPGDVLVATEFGAVENMPWVHSQPAEVVAEEARKVLGPENVEVQLDLEKLKPFDGLTVVCGSLYLVGEYLRKLDL